MEKAIIFKEWLKVRRVWIAVSVLAAALTVYAMIVVNRLITLKGVEHLWMIMLLKDNTFVEILKYLPVAVGMAIGVAQMAPEMQQKRLKLTLHLPFPKMRLCMVMLSFGLGLCLAVFAMQWVAVGIFYARIIPSQLTWRVLLTMLPWYAAGLICYLFTAAVCLEGTWRRRVIVTLAGVAMVMICYLQGALEAYNVFILLIIGYVCALVSLPLGSVERFKEGHQD